jgi:hypothetical protein
VLPPRECPVGLLPELAGLPQAARFRVRDRRDRHADPDGQLGLCQPLCWLVSKFHDFTVSFKSLTWSNSEVPGTLWLSDLLSP